MEKMLDFTKEREVTISFKNPKGEEFTFTGAISAYTLDKVAEMQKEMSELFAKDMEIDKDNITESDINIDTAKMLDIQKKMDKDLIKTFFGKEYVSYVKHSKGIENVTNEHVIKLLNEAIENVTLDIEGKEDEEETEGKK